MADTSAAKEITFFHYRDDAGRDVIVTDLNEVPKQYRDHMEILDEDTMSMRQHALDLKAAELVDKVKSSSLGKQAPASTPRSFLGVDGPSFAIGFVIALVLGAFIWSGRGGARPLRFIIKLVVVALGLVLAGSLYFGFVLRSAGLGDGSTTATPADAINEARKAVDKANATNSAQQKALDKIDH
jgi:hypothetical protein